MKLLPLNFSKIRGYAQRIVIVSETSVHTTVKNTVQKNALIYFGSLKTVPYASRLKPFGKRATSFLTRKSVELKDFARRCSIGTRHMILTSTQIMTNPQSPIFADVDFTFITRSPFLQAFWTAS